MATLVEVNASADALKVKVADVKTQVGDVRLKLAAAQKDLADLQATLQSGTVVSSADLDALKASIDGAVSELASV